MNEYYQSVNTRLLEIEKLLQQQILLDKNILNMEEACVFLGITRNHLYKLTSARKIPHSKPGGKKLFFKKNDLYNWAMGNQVCTQAEIDKEAINQVLNNKISLN